MVDDAASMTCVAVVDGKAKCVINRDPNAPYESVGRCRLNRWNPC